MNTREKIALGAIVFIGLGMLVWMLTLLLLPM